MLENLSSPCLVCPKINLIAVLHTSYLSGPRLSGSHTFDNVSKNTFLYPAPNPTSVLLLPLPDPPSMQHFPKHGHQTNVVRLVLSVQILSSFRLLSVSVVYPTPSPVPP